MVARLPLRYPEVVTLVNLDELPQKEAALHAGISLSGMKSRAQRARHALEQVLLDCCRIEIDATSGIFDYQLRGTTCGACADGCGTTGRAA